MKYLLLILSVLFVDISIANMTQRKCICWHGYRPEKIQGSEQCLGVLVSHVMSCNIPQPPACTCTGHDGILKDQSGTWCTIYKRGTEIMRWPCENTDDWERFFAKYKQYRQRMSVVKYDA